MEMTHLKEAAGKVLESCSRVIVGKEEAIQLIFTSFLCSGHVLFGGWCRERENAAASGVCEDRRQRIQTDPVYAGPSALRSYGDQFLQSEIGRI